jgi:phospholipid-transporting ATPase
MLGTYTSLFESPISPFTTLGPLIVVLAVSLLQEGATDLKRHRSDDEVWGVTVKCVTVK